MKYRITDARGQDYYNDVDLYDTEEAAEIALREAQQWAQEQARVEPSWADSQLRIQEVPQLRRFRYLIGNPLVHDATYEAYTEEEAWEMAEEEYGSHCFFDSSVMREVIEESAHA